MSQFIKAQILGILVKTPELQKDNNGDSYCYFSLAINPSKKQAEEGRGTTLFVDCYARKWNALSVSKAQKGDTVLIMDAIPHLKKRTVDKDGVKTVYSNYEFSCGRLDVFPRVSRSESVQDANEDGSYGSDYNAPAKTYASDRENAKQTGNVSDQVADVDLTADEQELVGQLPF